MFINFKYAIKFFKHEDICSKTVCVVHCTVEVHQSEKVNNSQIKQYTYNQGSVESFGIDSLLWIFCFIR